MRSLPLQLPLGAMLPPGRCGGMGSGVAPFRRGGCGQSRGWLYPIAANFSSLRLETHLLFLSQAVACLLSSRLEGGKAGKRVDYKASPGDGEKPEGARSLPLLATFWQRDAQAAEPQKNIARPEPFHNNTITSAPRCQAGGINCPPSSFYH